ncbi:TTPAL (predicted) [Pycnogonum litorale]
MALHDDLSKLSPNLEKKAELELQEKTEWRERDVQALRDMVISGDIRLNACVDGKFLLRFLRARKFDYDKAYDLLIKYYSSRINNPDLFKDFIPSSVKHVFAENFQGFLPDRDLHGRLVFLYRAGMWDPEKCTVDDIFRANIISMEMAIEDDATQINGIVTVLDLQGLRLNQLRHFTPSYMKKVISMIQDAFPARFKAFHIIHESTLIDVLYAVVRAFLSSKIRDRIYFHGDSLSSLHQHVPQNILPLELGGTKGPYENVEWCNMLLSNENLFIERSRYGFADDTNLQEVNSTVHTMLGTYKRVCID